MADIKVLTLVGSLRAASVNRQLAELAAEAAPDGVTLTIYEGLGDLPFYNEDIDTDDAPAAVVTPAGGSRAGRRHARGDTGVQREHPGCAEERHRLAVAAVRKRRARRTSHWPSSAPSFGQYGGVWAHDETRKSFGIAGPRVVESVKLSVPAKTLDGKHPRENAEVAAAVRDVVGKLAAEVS